MPRFIGRLWLTLAVLALPSQLAAAERLCDPAFEDCRAALINLIRAEQTGIDVAFWFMEDTRFSTELIKKAQQGVPVRVLVDPRANVNTPLNGQVLAQLANAGIPMRQRVASGILHWKMMLFAGQRTVEFSGANYSPDAFVFTDPYRNYVDESVFFTDDLALVQSFMRRYDDRWTDTTDYANYANVTSTPSRRYSLYSIDPALNFPPAQDYRARAVGRYNAERSAIDAIMYRITDRAHSDAIIAALNRGVHVRLITEQVQYRDVTRLWDSWNVDRLYMAGVEIRQRGHLGLSHQKSVILRGQGLVIFGSSNWTSPSAQSQEEHNYFTTKPWMLAWFQDQFDRKWNNLGPSPETEAFTPLPPGNVANASPADGASGQPQSTTLQFDAGPFAHLYDIYLGTTPDPPLVAANVELGPTEAPSSPRRYVLTPLAPSTTYYWKVVAKTMAYKTKTGQVWSFTTGAFPASTQPPPQPIPAPPTPTPAQPSPSPSPAPAPTPAPAPAPTPQPAPAPAGPSQPAMTIDTPQHDASVRQPFMLAGWAIDAGARQNAGVDVVHVYAYPLSGAAPIFLGAAPVVFARPDVAAFVGGTFTNSGYGLLVRGLAPGSYMLVAFAHSTVAGTFVLSRTVNVRVETSAVVVLDAPASGSLVNNGFFIGGWALDTAAASGAGVDFLHVYAYPSGGGNAVFLGQVAVTGARPDVGGLYGSQFSRSGFGMRAPALPIGDYLLVAFAHSAVQNTFTATATAAITVR